MYGSMFFFCSSHTFDFERMNGGAVPMGFTRRRDRLVDRGA
jgi:hypothetical protein